MSEVKQEEGKNGAPTTNGNLDIDTAIAIKKSLIIQVMGKYKGEKLIEAVTKKPLDYVNDEREVIKSLAKLVLSMQKKNMNIAGLYAIIEELRSEVSHLKKQKEPRKWLQVGKLNDIESLVQRYNVLEYEYGIQYNSGLGCVHPVIFNSWNRGLRITTKFSYPMGDSAKSLKYGRVVLTKGLDDAEDKTKWYQHYIYEANDVYCASNGVCNLNVFVRFM